MATGDGFESRLITGLAEHLDAANVGTWRASGAYTADEIAIVDRAIPQTPDRVITLTDYVVGGKPDGLADQVVGVQVRVRGTTDPRVCRDLGAEIFDLLDSSGRQTWGDDVSIVDVWRQSYTSLGQDGNSRWEASHNYYVAAMRPTIHRTD